MNLLDRNTLRMLFLIVICTLSVDAISKEKTNFSLTVGNIRSDYGVIRLLLFDQPEGFPNTKEGAMKVIDIDAKKGAVTFPSISLDKKQYAVAVYHDEDNDKKLDTNFIGIPTEGVAVSNNAKGIFGPPSYKDAAVQFDSTDSKIKLELSY